MPSIKHDFKLAARRISRRANVLDQAYQVANQVRVRAGRRLSDEQWAMRKYAENTGRKLNLHDPRGFNEKIWWLKLNNRDPLLTRCSDKVTVRDYVTEAGYGSTLNEIYGVFDSIHDVDFGSLPLPAYLKTNHGSGANMLIPAGGAVQHASVVKRFDKALKTNYYWQSREWNYKDIEPKIIAEKLLPDAERLVDYRFLCFDGQVRLVFVDRHAANPDGTHSAKAQRNVHNRAFAPLDVKVFLESYPESRLPCPPRYQEMVAMAEKLSEPFVFARVDLYNIDGTILFGEITFYPGGGSQIAEPLSYEEEWGSWIDLQSPKIVLSADG